MPIDPTFIALGVQAIVAIGRQIELYSREGAVDAEALAAAHAKVTAFLGLVQAEVDKRRSHA